MIIAKGMTITKTIDHEAHPPASRMIMTTITSPDHGDHRHADDDHGNAPALNEAPAAEPQPDPVVAAVEASVASATADGSLEPDVNHEPERAREEQVEENAAHADDADAEHASHGEHAFEQWCPKTR